MSDEALPDDHDDLDAFDDAEELFDAFPHLKAVPRLARLVANLPWFQNIGIPANAGLYDIAERYAVEIGLPDCRPVFLTETEDALAAALSNDINTEAWELEEQARAGLGNRITEMLDEEIASMVLTHLSEVSHAAIESGARLAAVRQGLSDEDFVTAVVGAGVQAVHQAGLVALSGEEDHPFITRFRLFESGHWPIALVGTSFLIF